MFNLGNKFLDPEKVLFSTGLTSGQSVTDLGAGAGFYAVAAAKIVGDNGKIFVVDILESALEHVQAEARLKSLRNITALRCDLEQAEACLKIPDGSMDLIVMANIAHQIKNKQNLFQEAYRLLKTGGKILFIEWTDSLSPIGPSAAERVNEQEVKSLAAKHNLKLERNVETDSYHYGLIFIK